MDSFKETSTLKYVTKETSSSLKYIAKETSPPPPITMEPPPPPPVTKETPPPPITKETLSSICNMHIHIVEMDADSSFV